MRGERSSALFGAARQLPVGFVERAADLVGAGHQGTRGQFGARGDLAVGIAEGIAGLRGQGRSHFQNLVAQCAGDHDRALFEHVADVVDACRQRALHGSGAFFDDSGLAAESILDLADIGSERIGDVVAALGERADMRLHDVVELLARFRDLAQVVFQCAGEDVATVAELGDVPGDRRVDRRIQFATRFRKLAQIVFKGASENIAAVRKRGHMAGDRRADRRVELATRFR